METILDISVWRNGQVSVILYNWQTRKAWVQEPEKNFLNGIYISFYILYVEGVLKKYLFYIYMETLHVMRKPF